MPVGSKPTSRDNGSSGSSGGRLNHGRLFRDYQALVRRFRGKRAAKAGIDSAFGKLGLIGAAVHKAQ